MNFRIDNSKKTNQHCKSVYSILALLDLFGMLDLAPFIFYLFVHGMVHIWWSEGTILESVLPSSPL